MGLRLFARKVPPAVAHHGVAAGRLREAAAPRALLREFNLEIGGGLGPVKGKVWRVGLMGETSTAGERALLPLLPGAAAQAPGREGRQRP